MMSNLVPIVTPYSNAVLRGPEGTDIGDLACELTAHDEGVITASAWEFSEEQRAMVAAGAHMRMSVWQHPIPPLALAIEAPFCGACNSELLWMADERDFRCVTADCPRAQGAKVSGE